LTAANF